MERILLVTSDYPPRRGGIASMLSTMVAHVPGLRPVVISESASYKEILKTFWKFRDHFDALFISHILPIGTAAFFYSIFTRTPYDILLHGLDFDLARSTYRKSIIARLVLRCARRVFANSKALAKEVSAFSGRSCSVLYPAVCDELIEASTLIGKREKKGTALLTVGRLVARKGHEKVIRALKDLPEFTYTIVGDGPIRKELDRMIVENNLTDRVTILQHVSDGRLPELYASHDMFVMPTIRSETDREGFGIVYLEAGLFHLPVVATRYPGVDEAVIDGETGVLIEDTDAALINALQTLSADSSLCERMGDTARERVLSSFVPQKAFAPLDAKEGRVYEQRPLVSVVIPTYQHAKTVAACIKSVQAQTYPSLEIIVVNDGSTDHTMEILREFRNTITVITQPNQGGNAARNRGLQATKGEYVVFADADVVMKPGMIEAFVEQLQKHPEASYAYSGFRFGWKRFFGVPFDGDALRHTNFIMTTSLVRKKDFSGFDPNLRRLQDWDVWLTMLEEGKRGVLVPGIWFSVVIDGESRTGSSWLPSFAYSLPWPMFGWTPKRIQKYQEAREILAKKHHLL